jgi:hypothetical protein
MGSVWSASLDRAYEAAIDMLEHALRACPEELWLASLWEVKRDDPGPGRGGRSAWPVERGLGEGLADDERIQVHSAFWYTAYHVVFFLDYYLSGGDNPYLDRDDAPFAPPPPFRGDDHDSTALPVRVYTRDELLNYLEYCRRKARTTMEMLMDEEAAKPARRGLPFVDILLHNLIHVAETAGQLNMFLGQKGVPPLPATVGPTSMEMLRDLVRGASDEQLDAFASSQGGFRPWLNRVFQLLAAQIQPAQDVAVGFSIEGVGGWTLRAADGRARWSPELGPVEAVVRITPHGFLRAITGALPRDDLMRSADVDVAAFERLFGQMPAPPPS